MAAAASSPATSGAGLVWYKVSDLRVHDHEPLFTAHQRHGAVVHVVCIDPRWFGTSPAGFPKTGFHRARFMSESIADLAGSLHGLGCSLVVRVARPEAVIPGIVEAAGVSAVYSHSEVCSEEQFADRQVRNALARLRKAPRFEQFWGNTMYHVDDLPFDPGTACPEMFSLFRRTAET
jgi:deoxyribodipyrimidine photo-lyase